MGGFYKIALVMSLQNPSKTLAAEFFNSNFPNCKCFPRDFAEFLEEH